ncbi:hypothetical protein QWW32_17165 [Rhodococcus sp. M8-20]|uniref:DUF6777 domain-containing protein n=1 Tax=Rhodococcus sp. M8-20 TaxID=3058375 RepID=UPI002ED4E7AC
MAAGTAARGFGMVLALTALAVGGCSTDGPSRTEPVRLDLATSRGEHPWSVLLLPDQVPVAVPPAPQAELPVPDDGPVTVSGDRTGLYGGSLERELCDRERLAGTLEQDPAKQEAWLDVFDVADARGYLRTLTPVLLRADTRVTDHEYRGGRAVPVQSVLEAGTVVLVDDRGVPRVRCAPGSPLLSPVLSSGQDLEGEGWSGLDEERLFVVQPGAAPVGELTVVDVTTGNLLAVPIGAGPKQPAPGAIDPVPPPAPEPSPALVPDVDIAAPAPRAPAPPRSRRHHRRHRHRHRHRRLPRRLRRSRFPRHRHRLRRLPRRLPRRHHRRSASSCRTGRRS